MAYGNVMGQTSSPLIVSHINNTNNPHQVTASQIGAATTQALNNHINDKTNPHDVTANQVGYNNSNVNDALNSLQSQITNIGNIANMFQNYEAIGYLENYRENQSIGQVNTVINRTVPWTSRPNEMPDLLVIQIDRDSSSISGLRVSGGEGCIIITGPDANKLGGNVTSLQQGGYIFGYNFENAPKSVVNRPDFPSCNFGNLNFSFLYFSRYARQFTSQPTRYDLFFNNLGTTLLSDIGIVPCVNNTQGYYYCGGFNWDLNNWYYSLFFTQDNFTVISFNVLLLKKKKTT